MKPSSLRLLLAFYEVQAHRKPGEQPVQPVFEAKHGEYEELIEKAILKERPVGEYVLTNTGRAAALAAINASEYRGVNVKLTYFKEGGKYYSSGSYISKRFALFEIWDEVKEMLREGKLPDLAEGTKEFTVLVEAPDHPHNHPHLIHPERRE